MVDTLEVVLAWLPVVAIAIAVIVVGRASTRSYSAHVAKVEQINAELAAVNREMLDELREIKHLLKDRA